MNVEVWFNGEFHSIAERNRTVELNDNSTFAELLDWILEEYKDPMEKLVSAKNQYFVLLNGHYFNPDKNMTKKLNDGDIIAFVTIVSGG